MPSGLSALALATRMVGAYTALYEDALDRRRVRVAEGTRRAAS